MSLEKYCFGEIGDHEVICGNERLFGGIKSIALLKPNQDTITDFTSNAQWDAAIADGSVKIIKEIRAEYPQPSETTSESEVAGLPDRVDSFSHVLTWRDRAVTQANSTFYDDLNEYTAGGVVWYEPKNNTIKVVDSIDVNFMAKSEVLADDKTVQVYAAQAMWDSIKLPVPYTAPANAENIFD